MKNFIYLLLFYQDTGFINNGKNFVQSTFLNLLKIIFYGNFNKYIKILLFRNLILKLLSVLYLPIGIILYFFKYRIYSTTPNSIGSYFEQLEIAQNKKKLIIISPECWCSNSHLEKYFFIKNYYFIKNNFLSFFLTPLTFINFIRFSMFDKKKLYFDQKQYYFNINEHNLQYEHNIIFENSSTKKFFELLNDLNIDLNDVRYRLSSYLNLNSKKKISIIHLRDEINDNLRNNDLNSFHKTIEYLKKSNFQILIFSKKKIKFDSSNIYWIEDNINNKEIQILSIINCNLYLGPISGPFHLAKFLNKEMVIVDCVIFNHLIHHNNYKVIYKKYFKDSKMMSLKSILDNNLECVWDRKILENKGIEVLNNNEEEILNATIEVLKKEFNQTIEENTLDFLFKDKNYSKETTNLMIRNTSNHFLKNFNLE